MGFRITPESLRKLCRDNGLYAHVPELNEVLHLQCKGITRLENLEAYTGLKTLYLENNAISSIEGVDCLTHLRCLYLGKNLIHRIQSLDKLTCLETLDLSDNDIHVIEGLAQLPVLHTLNISGNKLSSVHSIQQLTSCTSLTTLDISNNRLEDPATLDLLISCNLAYLRAAGNPVVQQHWSYRKYVVSNCDSLNFLDDSPCFDKERRLAKAFTSGGIAAERELRKQIADEEAEQREANRRSFDIMVERARQHPPQPHEANRFVANPTDGEEGTSAVLAQSSPQPIPAGTLLPEAANGEGTPEATMTSGSTTPELPSSSAMAMSMCAVDANQSAADADQIHIMLPGDGTLPSTGAFTAALALATQQAGTAGGAGPASPSLPRQLQEEIQQQATLRSRNPVHDSGNGLTEGRGEALGNTRPAWRPPNVHGASWSSLWERAKEVGERQEQAQEGDQPPSNAAGAATSPFDMEGGDTGSEDGATSLADSALNFAGEGGIAAIPPGARMDTDSARDYSSDSGTDALDTFPAPVIPATGGPALTGVDAVQAPAEVNLGLVADLGAGLGLRQGLLPINTGLVSSAPAAWRLEGFRHPVESDVDSDDMLMRPQRHHVGGHQRQRSAELDLGPREDSAYEIRVQTQRRHARRSAGVAQAAGSRQSGGGAGAGVGSGVSAFAGLADSPMSMNIRPVFVPIDEPLTRHDSAQDLSRLDLGPDPDPSGQSTLAGAGSPGASGLLDQARAVVQRSASGGRPTPNTVADMYYTLASELADPESLAKARAVVFGRAQSGGAGEGQAVASHHGGPLCDSADDLELILANERHQAGQAPGQAQQPQ